MVFFKENDFVCCPSLNVLTHLPLDKMAAISQTTFSNAFSWMKMLEFRFSFQSPIDNKSASDQVIACRLFGANP